MYRRTTVTDTETVTALIRRAAFGLLLVLAALSSWSADPAPAAIDASSVHNYRGVVPVLVYHGIDVVPRRG